MTSRVDRLDDDIARERRRERETRERDDGDDTDGIDVDAPVAHRATAIERRVTIIDRIRWIFPRRRRRFGKYERWMFGKYPRDTGARLRLDGYILSYATLFSLSPSVAYAFCARRNRSAARVAAASPTTLSGWVSRAMRRNARLISSDVASASLVSRRKIL